MTASAAPPIDPASLLKAIATRLNNDGGIKSAGDVPELIQTMDAAEKTPARCLYTCILKATKKDDVLRHFISSGGLVTLHKWMTTAQTHKNFVFLVDLLKVLRQLPVTVDDLRGNKDTAKMIRKLSKLESSSDVRELSQQLMDMWKRDVIGAKGDDENPGRRSRLVARAEHARPEKIPQQRLTLGLSRRYF